MDPILLIGGGGHCISCIDVLRSENKYEIAGILDTIDKVGSYVEGIEIIGTDSDIVLHAKKIKNFLITIGQIKSAEKRISIYNLIKSAGGQLPVISSVNSYVSPSAVIGEGTIVMHNAFVNAQAVIGKCCILNTSSLIEHEACIGDFCHVSTAAVINGQVSIGNSCFIGSNSVVANNKNIVGNSIVSAGSQVLKNIEICGTYIGQPLRKV